MSSVLAMAILAFATGLSKAPICCAWDGPCCPMGQDSPATSHCKMGAPIPECCRPVVRKETTPQSGRLGPRPDAPVLATLPIVPTVAASPLSEMRPLQAPRGLRLGCSPAPSASRAPPLS